MRTGRLCPHLHQRQLNRPAALPHSTRSDTAIRHGFPGAGYACGRRSESQSKSNDSQSNSNTPKAKQPNAIYDPSKNARQSSPSQNNSYVQKPSLAPPTLPIESWNSYSNRSYYQPIENNFTYPTLTQQLLFMNLLNNRNHNNYYYNDYYYYDDNNYIASESKDEESDNAEEQEPYMIFVIVLLLVVGFGFFTILLS